MEKSQFYRLVEEAASLDAGAVKGGEALAELRWDSLAVVSFIGLVDEQLGVTLEPKRVSACKSVEDLVALLDGKVTG